MIGLSCGCRPNSKNLLVFRHSRPDFAGHQNVADQISIYWYGSSASLDLNECPSFMLTASDVAIDMNQAYEFGIYSYLGKLAPCSRFHKDDTSPGNIISFITI